MDTQCLKVFGHFLMTFPQSLPPINSAKFITVECCHLLETFLFLFFWAFRVPCSSSYLPSVPFVSFPPPWLCPLPLSLCVLLPRLYLPPHMLLKWKYLPDSFPVGTWDMDFWLSAHHSSLDVLCHLKIDMPQIGPIFFRKPNPPPNLASSINSFSTSLALT